jgi:hypothetical protein
MLRLERIVYEQKLSDEETRVLMALQTWLRTAGAHLSALNTHRARAATLETRPPIPRLPIPIGMGGSRQR